MPGTTVRHDLRLALRQHVRQRGYAMAVIGTLALVTGATTAVFSVVNGVLLRALPYAAPDRVMWVASVRTDNPGAPFTLPEFMDYRAQARTLSDLAAYANWSASLAGDGAAERLQGARVSANLFHLLGVRAAAGRLLHDGDDRPDAAPVVVLSHRLWQRRYGGRPEIIGRAVRINAESFVVAGVLPAVWPLPLRDIDVVTPLAPERDPLRHLRGSVNFLRLVGRLAPGVDARQAEAELTAIARSLRTQFPIEYARKEGVRVQPLHDVLVGDHRQAILLLFAAVGLVLATALANLVSLALMRAAGRRLELTVRTALGASRRHLARQLATEGVLLAIAGNALGAVVAAAAVRLAIRWAPSSIPRLDEIGVDATVSLFVVALTLLVTVLLTLASLTTIATTRAQDALRPASRGAIGDRWNGRLRSVIVVAEIAAALVLTVATGALVQGLRDLQHVPPGFTADGVFQARVAIPATYRTPVDVGRFYDRLSERLATAPGVERLGVISVAPLSGLLATVPVSVAGRDASPRDRVGVIYRLITPGYLQTVHTRLLEGRGVDDTDRSETPAVALVSAGLAARVLGGRALGQRLLVNDNSAGPRPVEIVGVVEDVRHTALDQPPAFDLYLPLRQIHPDGVPALRTNQFWMVRTASDAGAFRATFLEHLRAVDPDAAASNVGAMREVVRESLAPRRFNLTLLAAFALTAVLLAVVGLHGLVSYAVSQREREIGLRMAIGATDAQIRRLILRHAATLGVLGATAGLALILAARVPLAAHLAADVVAPPSLAALAAAGLVGVVLAAAWRPARRAARTAPTVALRAE
jgi:predicted permease